MLRTKFRWILTQKNHSTALQSSLISSNLKREYGNIIKRDSCSHMLSPNSGFFYITECLINASTLVSEQVSKWASERQSVDTKASRFNESEIMHVTNNVGHVVI